MSTLAIPLPLAVVPPASPAAAPARPKAGLPARFPAFPLQRTANPFRAFSDPTDQLLTAGSTRMLTGHPYPTDASGWVRYVPLGEGSGASAPTSSPSAPVSAPPSLPSTVSPPSSSDSGVVVAGVLKPVDRKGKGKEVVTKTSDGGEEAASRVPGPVQLDPNDEGFGRYLADRLGDHPSFAIPLTDDDLPSDDAFFSPDSSSPFSLDNPSYSSYFAPTAYTTASLDKTPHDQSISHNMFRLSADVEGEHAKYEGFLERHVALEKEHGILRKQHADGAANRLKLNIMINDLEALIYGQDSEAGAGKVAVQTQRTSQPKKRTAPPAAESSTLDAHKDKKSKKTPK